MKPQREPDNVEKGRPVAPTPGYRRFEDAYVGLTLPNRQPLNPILTIS